MCVGAGSLTGSGETAESEHPCSSSHWTKKEAKAQVNRFIEVRKESRQIFKFGQEFF